jgi:hypothetical protein
MSAMPSMFSAISPPAAAAILELRGELLQLVGANVPADAKRAAHDNALRLFRELRGMFGVSS